MAFRHSQPPPTAPSQLETQRDHFLVHHPLALVAKRVHVLPPLELHAALKMLLPDQETMWLSRSRLEPPFIPRIRRHRDSHGGGAAVGRPPRGLASEMGLQAGDHQVDTALEQAGAVVPIELRRQGA
jgi:hypothetical protein